MLLNKTFCKEINFGPIVILLYVWHLKVTLLLYPDLPDLLSLLKFIDCVTKGRLGSGQGFPTSVELYSIFFSLYMTYGDDYS